MGFQKEKNKKGGGLTYMNQRRLTKEEGVSLTYWVRKGGAKKIQEFPESPSKPEEGGRIQV